MLYLAVIICGIALSANVVDTVDNEGNDNDGVNYANILCSLKPTFGFCKQLTAAKALPFLAAGRDTKFEIPAFGTFGIGNIDRNIAAFKPGEAENSGSNSLWTETLQDYDKSDTSGALKRSRVGFLSLDGLGTFDVGKTSEKGIGLTDVANTVSSLIFPYALLPRLRKIEEQNAHVKREFDDLDLETNTPERSAEDQAAETVDSKPIVQESPIDTISWYSGTGNNRTQTVDSLPRNPFDQIKERQNTLVRVAGTKTLTSDDVDDKQPKYTAGEDDTLKKAAAIYSTTLQRLPPNKLPGTLSGLGLKPEEIQRLCKRFEPIAAEYCYKPKIDENFVEKCRGYTVDCIGNNNPHLNSPLAAAANAFTSSVGATYNYYGVNGIPYYPINDEGSIDGGHNGKADFGSWGGGYTDDVNIRDYFHQKTESGGNWYQGLYGYKTGWSVPIVEQFGVEGGGGTQASVPLNEHHIGGPLGFTTGYHVGPYIGVLNNVGVDWYNGGVSTKRAFASPIVGVSGSSSTGFTFPSLELFMKHFGLENFSTAETNFPTVLSQ